jgi:hypothetical protein
MGTICLSGRRCSPGGSARATWTTYCTSGTPDTSSWEEDGEDNVAPDVVLLLPDRLSLVQKRLTRFANRLLRQALVEDARGAVFKRDSYLAAQYHRLVKRCGDKKALVAVAHSILVIATTCCGTTNRTASWAATTSTA